MTKSVALDFDNERDLTIAELKERIGRVRLREATLLTKIDALDALIKTIKAHSAALVSLHND